ncbi:MFS transporter [Arenibacter sp. GZD96]|uniref:MDR family MFS transporter n=1 Tax=Aurantibrevibacter litoralis TaxID=3106030 RepID=UPI002B0024CF|nr:MFS transporter [Arenibacter sp. GZD-96]MEA1787031.1 MFS transporter [Arenibacter sp. GZD-96]
MKKLYLGYINSFSGLSAEVWWLALITLINRAGAMVIPFLSLYLTKDLGFTLAHVGTIMTFFGLGSLVGTWVGGKLTDVIGYYKVMLISLVVSGFLFILLQYLHDFWQVCAGVFVLLVFADAFRPAAFVALIAYSKPQNKTRTVTLLRLAINLGFSIGPALGGIIVSTMSYSGLFWTDGATCILAGLLLFFVLNPKKAIVTDSSKNENPKSAYRDGPYMLFIGAMILFGFAFVQYFSTIPLYYKDAYQLTEWHIGLLLGMNGFLIFAFEMPLITYMEATGRPILTQVLIGFLLVGLSFMVLNLFPWSGVLVIGMLCMTLGEMIAFPFSNAFAMERAKMGKQGEYMALYSIAFSISHVFAHNLGMQSIANFGYTVTWYVIFLLTIIGILLLLRLKKYTRSKHFISLDK